MDQENSKLLIDETPVGIFFLYPEPITQEEAEQLQLNAGYHPNGYGFYNYHTTRGKTSWNCQSHCD